MRQIDKIIKSQSEPKDTNVLWLDTSNPEEHILKEYDGGWKPVAGGGGGGTSDAVQYVPQELNAEQQAQARTNIGAGTSNFNGNPVLVTEQELTDAQQMQARTNIGAGTYSKPANGIPASDLASGVIPTVPTALSQLSDDSTHRLVTDTEKSTWNGKQNALTFDSTPTANSTNPVTSGGVKAYVDGAIPTVPVTDVTVGGTSVLSNGTAVVPAIPDEVEANPTVPSGTTPTTLQNVKVGNNYYSVPQGSSTTLSTDVTTDKADNTKASTPKSVYDFVKPATGSSIPAGGLLAGVKYHLGTLTGSITMTLAAASDASVENEYKGDFTADSTAPTITWSGVTEWAGNCLDSGTGLPVITAGKHYEFNIENGYGLIAEFGV